MFGFELLKKKYDKLIKDTLIKNKSIIIESFVEYYGEEYRNIIYKRYNEIVFVYYIDWEYIKMVIDDFILTVDDPLKYSVFNDFYKFYNKSDNVIFKLFKNNNLKELPGNFIGTTNDNIFNVEYLRRKISENSLKGKTSTFNYGSIDSEPIIRIICFKILIHDEAAILHEINHAITKDAIAWIYDDEKIVNRVTKMGLETERSDERFLEELINEKMCYEIFSIFKEKGGNLTSFCYDIPFVCPYRYNLYLIDEFYDKFKDYIKIAKISDNKNYLTERIGKDNYKKFVELINKYYSEDLEEVNKSKQNVLDEIKELLQLMEENVNKSTELSDEDLNLYFEQLKKQGHIVRFLNNSNYGISEDNIYDGNNRKIR